jgi:hypothetical protein
MQAAGQTEMIALPARIFGDGYEDFTTTLNSKYVHSNLALNTFTKRGKRQESIDILVSHQQRRLIIFLTELLRKLRRDLFFLLYLECGHDLCLGGKTWKKARPELKILLGGPEEDST